MMWLVLLLLLVVWSVYISARGKKIRAVARQIRQLDKRWFPVIGHSYVFIGDSECLMNGICLIARDAIKKGGMTSFWNMDVYCRRLHSLDLSRGRAAEWQRVFRLQKRAVRTMARVPWDQSARTHFVTMDVLTLPCLLILQVALYVREHLDQYPTRAVVVDPAIAEYLFKNCLEKDEQLLRASRTLTGNGSIFAPVNIWHPRRKILAPTFSMRNLNRFVDVFAEQSAVLMDQLAPKVGAGDFSVWSHMNNYSFDALCETTLGIQAQSQQKTSKFLLIVEEVLRLMGERTCKAWMYNEVIYRMLPHYKQFYKSRQLVYDFVDKIVKSKRLELAKRGSSTQAKNGIKVPSIVEMLIESSGCDGYTDLELREEVLVLLIAGTDTSAVGISFTIVMLSRHQEVQQKVYEELHEVFGESDRPLTAEDLPKLNYLEAVIKETLRLYPPVPVTAREVHEDITLPSGTTLVKDVTIMFSHWGVHHNPLYWGDDAEEFRPERFLEEPLRHPAQFIPFSYGIRNCLGYQYAMMSLKTVVASFLRHYRVLPPADLDPRQLKAPLRVKYVIDMKHVDNYIVRIEKRNS